MSIEENLNEIEPYLKYIIIDLQKSDTSRIHLTIAITFTSSKDINKNCKYIKERKEKKNKKCIHKVIYRSYDL